MPRQSRFGRAAELPPRTRRIPIFGDKRSFYGGTTSAYAENTSGTGTCPPWVRNYLRVRGEYVSGGVSSMPSRGTTSAYAENTVDR